MAQGARTILLDEGPTLAENLMAEKITIINAKDESVSILVSPDTHLPLQKIFTIRDPQTREREEEVEIYGNWRIVQGINTPCSVQIKHSGQIVRQQIITTSVTTPIRQILISPPVPALSSTPANSSSGPRFVVKKQQPGFAGSV